jgi:nucleolar protein 56
MEKYLFSNCLGVFVFDESFSVIDRTELAEEDLDKLEHNAWIEKERHLIEKYSKNKLYFIGFKKEKQSGIILSQDPKKMSRILEYFAKSEFLNEMYAVILKRTKQKVKASTEKDLLIIQASDHIDELNKSISLLCRRLREWYELYNPEFSQSIDDHEKFVELIISKGRKELLKDIHLAEKDSMGADLDEKDIVPMLALAKQIYDLYALKAAQENYLQSLMDEAARNLNAIAGSLIGAKLIALAGSLKNMAEMPASTIQVLGAERALFRHLRNKSSKPPKYRVIMQHPLIANAKRQMHGKVSRALASKISIAVKMDYFGHGFIGDELRKNLEAKFHG